MGMYDYIGGEQIKIFYRPIFNENENSTWHSGGQLRSYGVESELPLKELWYKYPKNFCIFAFNFDMEDVWVIKNGKFAEFKNYAKINKDDIGEAIYNYYGSELNIKSSEDLINIKYEYNLAIKLCNERENIICNGRNQFDLMHEDIDLYESNYQPKIKQAREETIGLFNKKWYKTSLYHKEQQFGEFVECYLFYKYTEDLDDYHKERLPKCIEAFKMFILNNVGIVETYLNWHGGKSIRKMINIIVKDVLTN